jgi:hypothetical protein
MPEIKVIRKMFGPEKDEEGIVGYYVRRNLMVYVGHLVFFVQEL